MRKSDGFPRKSEGQQSKIDGNDECFRIMERGEATALDVARNEIVTPYARTHGLSQKTNLSLQAYGPEKVSLAVSTSPVVRLLDFAKKEHRVENE